MSLMLHLFRAGVLAGVVFGISSLATAVNLRVNPGCPSATQPITIIAYESSPPPGIFPDAPSVTVVGNVISIVAYGAENAIDGAPPSELDVPIGTLAAGTYQVQFFLRFQEGSGTWGAPQLSATTALSVTTDTHNCSGASIRPIGPTYQSTSPNTSFGAPLSVSVTDEQGNGIDGVTVTFFRHSRPEDLINVGAPIPAATLSTESVITSNGGRASVAATANGVAGVSTYGAYISDAGVTRYAYFILANRPGNPGDGAVPVVEFFSANLNHYFMTEDPTEMAVLDVGSIPGWERTGGVFLGYPSGTAARLSGLRPVCRYYGLPEAGLNTHFFSAFPEECNAVPILFPNIWELETNDAFEIYVPDPATGSCRVNTIPVHRAYNESPDANHRYSTSMAVIDQMVETGWVAEGYGVDAVVMCAAQ